MVKLIFGRPSMMLLGVVATASMAFSQLATTPKITSISTITTAEHQTITITGTGFGTHSPYTGDSKFISFYDSTKKWEAGYEPDKDTVTLIVNSWTNTKITVGGFAGKWGTQDFTLAVGNKEEIRIWNAQSAGGSEGIACNAGCATKTVTIAKAATATELRSSTKQSVYGEPVTFKAVVTSGDGVPRDGEKVSFMNGAELLGTGTLHNGFASLTVSNLEFGDTTIRAVYEGDSDLEGTRPDEASASVIHTVN